MRALQITRFGGPEVLDVVDLPDPVPGDGVPVSTCGTDLRPEDPVELADRAHGGSAAAGAAVGAGSGSAFGTTFGSVSARAAGTA